MAFASDSSMGGIRDELAAMIANTGHTQEVGLSAGSGAESSLLDDSSDWRSGAVDGLGNSEDGMTGMKHANNGASVDFGYINGPILSDGDASQVEMPLDGFSLHSDLLADLVAVHSGSVQILDVVDVEILHVDSVLVYDLQTESTTYIANGIISSNCRCVAIPLVENGLPPAGKPEGDFVTKTSDGKKRAGDPNLFEKATGGAKKPSFEFRDQNPVTANEAEIETMITAVRTVAGDTVADLLKMVTANVMQALKVNRDLITGEDGKKGPRGFIGSTGATGDTGETGSDGATGDKGERGERGLKGFIGPKGNTGETGERGRDGRFGMRGKDGQKGTKGDQGRAGRDGRDGVDGTTPDHEIKLNKQGDPSEIRFQRPDSNWGAWLKLNADNVALPAIKTGVQDVEIMGRRLRFKLPDGDWTKWVLFGGGGGGGAGGGAVSTDETISGDGETATPLRSYGIVNSLIDQDVTVAANQTMINHQIDIDEGSTIDVETGGQLHLI